MHSASLEQRDFCCKMILEEYSIDENLKPILETVIPKFANSNLSPQIVKQMLDKKMSLFSNINTLKTNINIFGGYICEFLCVYEYNMHRNKDHITTILNPDSSSKTDLLHIITTSKGQIIVPGGDVKSGGPDYVLNQYEKMLKSKYDIPFIDYSGHLTKNKHHLSPKQKERMENLLKEYPNKKPIDPIFSPIDITRIKHDILAYFETGYLPSEREKYNLDFKIERYTKNREAREELVRLAVSHKYEGESVDWSNLRSNTFLRWSKYYEELEKLEQSRYFFEKEEWSHSDLSLDPEEQLNKQGIEKELNKLREKRASYNSDKVATERNAFMRVLKKGGNIIARVWFDMMNDEKMTILQNRLNSQNYTQNVEEIYYELAETKRLESEQMDYEDEDDSYDYDEDNYDYYEDSNYDNYTTSSSDRSAPIAHSVRAHTRTLRDGREIFVREHQRGRND